MKLAGLILATFTALYIRNNFSATANVLCIQYDFRFVERRAQDIIEVLQASNHIPVASTSSNLRKIIIRDFTTIGSGLLVCIERYFPNYIWITSWPKKAPVFEWNQFNAGFECYKALVDQPSSIES